MPKMQMAAFFGKSLLSQLLHYLESHAFIRSVTVILLTDPTMYSKDAMMMLMTTMTSLQENMAKLLQRSNEPTNTPIPVYSPQTLGLPVSYPWQGNKSTPSPMVDPPNPVTTNHNGQSFQPMGQYSHPTWQRPLPRAWGQSPWGHL